MSAATWAPVYKLVKGDGMGGFLSPPGHWSHRWHVEEYATARSRNPVGTYSLEYVFDPGLHTPETLRARVQKIMDGSALVCSELWLRSVYTHFRRCYSPDGIDTRTENAVTGSGLATQYIIEAGLDRDATPERRAEVRSAAATRAAARLAAMPADWHLAVMWVRRFFPDHEPRLDLITDPRGTTGPCVKCGRQVQYEPRVDALATVSTSHRSRTVGAWAEAAVCTDGTAHNLEVSA
jgi:hypothetical protein